MSFSKLPDALPAGIAGPLATLVRDETRVLEFRLENGLRVLLAERHMDPVVAVMTWYQVGARNETEREAGVSHFLEHMMFKGSERFGKGQVDLLTTTLGGSNNAFTAADHTAYWFEFASDRWEKALELESDRMRGLLLDGKEFDAEKAVVLEKLAMGEDDPWRNLTQEVGHHLFSRHPYRRPVIGYADTLRKLSVEEMRDYYRRFYHPGNATLVVCGDVDAGEALASIVRHFASIPAGVAYDAADPPRPPVPEPKGEQRLSLTWDDQASRLCIAWPTTVVGSKDDHVLDVVSTLLTGGRLSRLYRKLVLGSAIATSISTHNDTRRETGSFWLFAELAQGRAPAELERAVDAELTRLAAEPVPADELARAKRTILAGEAYDSETVSDVAEEIGEYAVDVEWKEAFETKTHIQKVTAKEVADCVKRLLATQRRVLGWSLPEKAKANGEQRLRGSTGAKRRASAAKATPRRAAGTKSARTTGAKSAGTTRSKARTAKRTPSRSKAARTRGGAR
ncbi:MAG: insulinase family protein [Planctomycetes bacterium]|nr:insulinase family protein [Planctomycetota bacterium]